MAAQRWNIYQNNCDNIILKLRETSRLHNFY
jgi:hypothetical protein